MATDLDTIGRLIAFTAGRAVRAATRRTVTVMPDPIVLVPLTAPGDPSRLFAVSVGGRGAARTFLSVPDPFDRDEQRELLAALGRELCSLCPAGGADGAFPQAWVSCDDAVDWMDIVAQHVRSHPGPPGLEELCELCGYWSGRRPVPGQQAVAVAPRVVTALFRTGQHPAADHHLGAALSWFDDRPRTPDEAARDAFLAALTAMGTTTDPALDRDHLAPLIGRYRKTDDAGQRDGIAAAIGAHLERAAQPIRDGILSAMAIVDGSGIPEIPDIGELIGRERSAFSSFVEDRRRGRPLSAALDARSANLLLEDMRAAQTNLLGTTLRSDGFQRAEAGQDGRLISGTVILVDAAEATIELSSRQQTLRVRPRDDFASTTDPRLKMRVLDVRGTHGDQHIRLRVTAGMLKPGLPVVGETLSLARHHPDWNQARQTIRHLRRRLQAPSWTHVHGAMPAATARPAPRDPLAAVEDLR